MRVSVPLSVVLLIVAGCSNTIKEVNDVRVAEPRALERLVFGDYWEAKGFPDRDVPLQSAAIASFRVELVEERLTPPDKYDQSQFYTVFGGTEDQIPAQLYGLLEKRFSERGLEITAASRVAGAPSYRGYPQRSGPEVVQFDRPIASMAGKIRKIRVRSAQGLAIVEGDAAAIAATDATLAAELGVDAIVHVTVRIGVWNGRATIEEGSVVTVRAGADKGVVTSQRTLASSSSVLMSRQYTANISGQYNVDPRRYASAMAEVFPAYIGLAAEAVRR